MKGVFVAGIGTAVGKTVIAAALTEALRADYWKPIQSGSIEGTDSETVRALVSPGIRIHPESFCLKEPLSPHAAAKAENRLLSLQEIRPPTTDNLLVVEGAGGLLVPVNDTELIIDLVKQLGLPVLLVSRNYLGSINHSLLSLEVLKARAIPVLGLVFNGHSAPESERVIEGISGVSVIARVPEYSDLESSSIADAAQRIAKGIKGYVE